MGTRILTRVTQGSPALVAYAKQLCAERLAAYREAPHDAEEHANIETSVLAGGYAYRQVAELIQNAADAIAEAAGSSAPNRIVVEVDERGLWCANTGMPIDESGVRALLNSHASGKRAGQIGRFGLGFKSLLRLGGTIDVFSRSVCLHFDPERNRDRIRVHLALPSHAPAPGLRLAEPSTWDEELAAVPDAGRFAWASTIVFAQLVTDGAHDAVSAEIRSFPAEFLLFLPCDVELSLKAPSVNRYLRRVTNADGLVSIEDVATERSPTQYWHVFETSVLVTDAAALEDATAVHARREVPLIWAAPVGVSRDAGRFFAFFPTSTESRTLGILNAPWKLNSDRTAVIPGAWNAVLMQAAAKLIVDNLPALGTDDDPGAVLDAFPRELTTSTEPAAPLVAALWNLLVETPVLPNCDLEPVHPALLRRAPQDDPELIRTWAQLVDSDACATLLHPSCTSTAARTGRLRQLSDRLVPPAGTPDDLPRLRATPALEWLEEVGNEDPDGAGEALRFADQYAAAVAGWRWDQLRNTVRIILTASNQLAAAPEVTLSSSAEAPLQLVHPVLRADPALVEILRHRFDVEDCDDTGWERLLQLRIEQAESSGDWNEVWKLLRRMPWGDFVAQAEWRVFSVRTLHGWQPADQVFRPGRLVQISDLDDICDGSTRNQLAEMLLDESFHSGDEALCTKLGITAQPSEQWVDAYGSLDETTVGGRWLHRWQELHTKRYHRALEFRPDINLLAPQSFNMPTGWQLLLLAPECRRAAVTVHFIGFLARTSPREYSNVVFWHRSRRNAWPAESYRHPIFLCLMQYGRLANRAEQIPLATVLTPELPDVTTLLPSLAPLSAHLLPLRAFLQGGADVVSADEAWAALLHFAAGEEAEPQTLSGLYNLAAENGRAPEWVCTSGGPAPIAEVRLASSRHEIALAAQAGVTAVCLSPTATRLWLACGARALDQEAQLEWISEADDAPTVMLLDLEPALRDVIKRSAAETACATLPALMERRIGDYRTAIDWTIEGGRLLVAQSALDDRSWSERILLLIEAASAVGWIEDEEAVEKALTSGVSARRRQVATEPDMPARLLRAMGGTYPLTQLFEADVQGILADDPHRLAQVALTLFGPSLLAVEGVRKALAGQGLEPPERWGTEAAADFVAAIGFPPEYAIAPGQRREAELAVSGPLPLKPLHDFQNDIVASLENLFADFSSRRRAVISLPTGAGKTRVAAETAVRHVLDSASRNRLVLWVAQSDELCEQAVQCFRELWSNVGSPGETLRLIRLWGGQNNPSPATNDEPTVIVASIQTLTSRMNDPALLWASRPGLIVIDECHHALTTAYSGLLRWLSPDMDSGEREPPIVGLSATPFRGRSEEETQLLARRFDNRLIPQQQSELFEKLQERGVLAKFRYTRLEIDERFVLSEEEERHLEKFQQLNESALTRLGENVERNDKILDEIAASDERSALVFATSVAHAHRLAARLNVMGISAATVTGGTDRASRRWFIQAFQKGDIRVLCNHSALTTGFDAPATDLIVIARPVFSPALYMQMVGRGLRGPANGGKDHCRIMTVQDNLDAYTGRLAHHYFERHYVLP